MRLSDLITTLRRRWFALSGSDEVVTSVQRQWHAVMGLVQATATQWQDIRRLPWFLVIGPTGAGKSALLAHADLGLAAISAAMAEQKSKDGGLTLWRNDQAVFIEVPGLLTGDPATRSGWRALLRLIHRERGLRPLRGVLIAKPLAEHFRRTPSDTAAEAHLLRDCLQDLSEITGAVVPSYVVVTKADLLGGFKEFFAAFGRAERDQVLGFTAPWPAERDPLPHATVAYERLLDNLRDRRPAAFAAAPHETARRKLMQMPVQLRAALPYLNDFLGGAVRPSAHGQALFRGLYLTSTVATTTVTSSVPGVEQAEAEFPKSISFAVPTKASPATIAATPTTTPTEVPTNAWFVRDLFAHVILPDAVLATLTPRAARRWWMHRLCALVVVPLIVCTALVWSVWSTTHGIQLIDDLRQPLAVVEESDRGAHADLTARLLALDRLGSAVQRAIEHHGSRLGAAGEVAAHGYLRSLRPLLLDACLSALHADLDALRRQPEVMSTASDRSTDLVQAYQMLGGMIEVRSAFLASALTAHRHWFRAVDPQSGGSCEVRIEALARRQLDRCIDTLLPSGLLRLDIDHPLVDALGHELGERLQVDQAYDRMIHGLEGSFTTVPLEALIDDPEQSALTSGTRINKLYTQAAFDATVTGAIEEQATAVSAALDATHLPHERSAIVKRLRERFAADQQEHWRAAISGMRAAHVRDLRDTPTQLDLLCGTESPIPRFLGRVEAQAHLDFPGVEVELRTESGVIQPCLQIIAGLRTEVLDYQQAALLPKRPTEAERFRTLVGRFNAASARLHETLARVEPAAHRLALQAGFDNLLRSLLGGQDQALVTELDQFWSQQVYQTFAAHLATRFPFAPEASDDAPMVEFESFFNPTGSLWSTLSQVETLRDLQVLGRPAVTLDADYQRVLKAAREIRSLFFAGSSPTLTLRFPFRLLQREHVRDLRLQFGAKTNTLYERPDARYVAEIVHGDPYGARISLQTVTGEWKHREDLRGDWGFLRLLRAGQPKASTNGDFICTWEHAGADATQALKASVVLEAGGIEQVVAGDLLSGLALPRRLLRTDDAR